MTRFPHFEFLVLLSKTIRKLICVLGFFGEVNIIQFMLDFVEKYDFGTPSESSGIQNDGKNRPYGAKDLELLLSLSSSNPLVDPTGAQEPA